MNIALALLSSVILGYLLWFAIFLTNQAYFYLVLVLLVVSLTWVIHGLLKKYVWKKSVLEKAKNQTQELLSKPNYTKLALCLAIILTWLSLWFSYRTQTYSDQAVTDYLNSSLALKAPIAARAGFPLTTFYFPVPPLGNDIPDQGSFFPFALNVMLWFLFSFYFLHYLPKKWLKQKFEQGLVYSAFVLSLFGLFWVILQYD